MRSGNPVFRENAFAQDATYEVGEVMTVQGTVNKTSILLLLVIFGASVVWRNPVAFLPFLMPSAIGALVLAMVTVFNRKIVMYTAPMYAAVEGLLLGTISALMERQFPGIVIQAVGLTFGTLFAMLFLYKSRIITVTHKLRMGIAAATGGVFLFYLASMIMGMFGAQVPLLHNSGPIGIGFSLVIVGIAAFNLLLDFDMIEQGVRQGAPKRMEWYGAFGIMVTLVWLYMEILRLLSKVRNR